MSDPTIADMRAFIDRLPFASERSDFDREEAIYWFANDWHSGQASNLYAALCASEFSPGPIACEPQDIASMLYNELQAYFMQVQS